MLISFFASFIIVSNKNTPEFWKCRDPDEFGMLLKHSLSAGRAMQCRCEFGLLQCSVLDSESMFCFCNESNQKVNQYGWRHFTDVRRDLCRFYMYVKINFPYRKKKKNPFLIHRAFKYPCLWTQNAELEGRCAFQV